MMKFSIYSLKHTKSGIFLFCSIAEKYFQLGYIKTLKQVNVCKFKAEH
jgi:hypothetical protein